jgi:hypothetical protein
MKVWTLAAATLLVGQAVHAQADPNDVTTLDDIIRAYYEVVSGPAGEAADRARDETLHWQVAQIGIAGIGRDGSPILRTMTLSEYHDSFGGPRQNAFYETEAHRVTQRFGNIAHVWSTYEYRDAPDGQKTGGGINSIQLFHDGARWWITSWVFDSERAGNPIPSEYLDQGTANGGPQ